MRCVTEITFGTPLVGNDKVLRGGSWERLRGGIRSTRKGIWVRNLDRNWCWMNVLDSCIGLRCTRSKNVEPFKKI